MRETGAARVFVMFMLLVVLGFWLVLAAALVPGFGRDVDGVGMTHIGLSLIAVGGIGSLASILLPTESSDHPGDGEVRQG